MRLFRNVCCDIAWKGFMRLAFSRQWLLVFQLVRMISIAVLFRSDFTGKTERLPTVGIL
jgi:hypothetical protein